MRTTLAWTRSTGDQCNRRYAQLRAPLRISEEAAIPSRFFGAEDDLDWHGRDGIVELADGRLVLMIRGNLACVQRRELNWVIPRRHFADCLNADVADPEERVSPRYASAPTLLPNGLLCVAVDGGVVSISDRGKIRAAARIQLVDDTGDSPNFDDDGNALLTTIDGELLCWNGSSAVTQEVRSGLGYDLVCPAVLPDGRLLVSSYAGSGLCLLSRSGQTAWCGVLEESDCVPTYSHGGKCLAGSLNEESSVAVTIDGALVWRLPEAATFASHPAGLLIAASASTLTALTERGETLWTFQLPHSESTVLGHFVCEDQTVVCATRKHCFAVAPPGNLLWSLGFEEITSAPIPLSSGSIALIADRGLVTL